MTFGEQLAAIEAAREEYAEDGIVATDTYFRLTTLGIDADHIIQQLEAGEEL